MDDLELLSDYSSYLKRKKEEGKKIVAFMAHDNIPEELIDAAGFVPLKLLFAGNEEIMDESHDYLPSSTCCFAQSCIGLFKIKPPMFDFLKLVDYFIVSNHCVSDICASEIITRYFNISRLNFYLSYTHSDTALKYFELELLDLKQQLEKIRGRNIRKDELYESVLKYNNLKKKISEINKLKIKGSKKLRIFQKAILFGPDSLNELENFLEQNKESSADSSNNLTDILLTGCSIFIGDYLIDLIEEGGGNIVYFDTWVGNNYFSQIFDDETLKKNENPLDLFVIRYKNNIYGDHIIPNYLENKVSQLESIIQEYQNKTGKKLGVILHVLKFCDHVSLYQSFIKKILQEKGFQVLILDRDFSKSSRGQIATRLGAFMEMM